MKPVVVADYKNIVGEGPLWHPKKNILFWIDIMEGRIFTLDPSRNKLKGESGLGLSIARDIIRSHGGEIKLEKAKIGGLKNMPSLLKIFCSA